MLRRAFALKPSSSAAAELDRDASRTDPHDMCPRWFGFSCTCGPEREQRTQRVDGDEIDTAQVDDQYAAVAYQPPGVRTHVVYVGRVDLAADGDHGEFGIGADPHTGSAAIDDCRAALTWRMVNVIELSSHEQAFARLAGTAESPSARRGPGNPDAFSTPRRKAAIPTRVECTPHLFNARPKTTDSPDISSRIPVSIPPAGDAHFRRRSSLRAWFMVSKHDLQAHPI